MFSYPCLCLLIQLGTHLLFLFFASDEVSAIVVDLGTHTCKAGYAGEDAPKAVFPSVSQFHLCVCVCFYLFLEASADFSSPSLCSGCEFS